MAEPRQSTVGNLTGGPVPHGPKPRWGARPVGKEILMKLTPPQRRSLTDVERDKLTEIGKYIAQKYDSMTPVIADLAKLKYRLPTTILEFFEDVKSNTLSPGFILSGFPFVDFAGPTPSSIEPNVNAMPPIELDSAYLALISGLGQPFTFNSIQHGNFVNHIVPIKENADKPISSGFNSDFGLHTEDAFHPGFGDFLTLLCVRNPGVATTISYMGDYDLSAETSACLRQAKFFIGNNIAHDVSINPKSSPIYFGSGPSAYMRVNFNNTSADKADEAGCNALAELHREAEKRLQRIVLMPGDVFIVDNLRVAHGREAYHPKFDGTDRWLKRLYVTTRWRTSAAFQLSDSPFILDGVAS